MFYRMYLFCILFVFILYFSCIYFVFILYFCILLFCHRNHNVFFCYFMFLYFLENPLGNIFTRLGGDDPPLVHFQAGLNLFIAASAYQWAEIYDPPIISIRNYTEKKSSRYKNYTELYGISILQAIRNYTELYGKQTSTL